MLRKASKRLDIPFKWEESNLESFDLVKDKSNKELARNKEVALTEEQIKQLYEYQPSGTEKQVEKNTEIRDLFVLQCLVGQRVSDMHKFFNGDNERDGGERYNIYRPAEDRSQGYHSSSSDGRRNYK